VIQGTRISCRSAFTLFHAVVNLSCWFKIGRSRSFTQLNNLDRRSDRTVQNCNCVTQLQQEIIFPPNTLHDMSLSCHYPILIQLLIILYLYPILHTKRALTEIGKIATNKFKKEKDNMIEKENECDFIWIKQINT
jgi:hypothetical protein